MRDKARLVNIIDYRTDQIYYEYECRHHIKDSELCLMYALDDGLPHSQKQICEDWHMPKTTLNTIIKQWEKLGYITLCHMPGKRRELLVTLTPQGNEYIKTIVKNIYLAEENAIEKTLKEYPNFIEAMQFYEKNLRKELLNKEDVYEDQ